MASTEARIATNAERRRSERWPLALPVLVRGTSLDSKSFQENTITLSVSSHGALLALSTTVTLGQTLFLHNPQTQKEAGAWVTRFGHPRGGMAQVGIEFVRPEEDFWSAKPLVKSPDGEASADGNQNQPVSAAPSHGNLLSPEIAAPMEAPAEQTFPSGIVTPPGTVPPEILLHALEHTLRQAAERAVATAATASLGPAMNRAAAAIENFGREQVRQIEQRLDQRRDDLAALARHDIYTHVQMLVARADEDLRKRAHEYFGEVARNAHRDFGERLRETANQVALQFAEDAIGASAQHFAGMAERIHNLATDAQVRMGSTAAEFSESQKRAKDEIELAVAETHKKIESLASRVNGALAESDARVRAFQDELDLTKDREIERFRERLRGVLTTLLNTLG